MAAPQVPGREVGHGGRDAAGAGARKWVRRAEVGAFDAHTGTERTQFQLRPNAGHAFSDERSARFYDPALDRATGTSVSRPS